MATIKLTVEVIGKPGVLARLKALESKARDLRPFWREVFAPKYFAGVQDVFALEGQRRGATGRFSAGHWAPLTARYAAWKLKRYGPKPINQREGVLVESLNWSGLGLGAGGVFEDGPRSVVVGTRIPYAAHVQRARRFLDPPDPAVYNPLLKLWLKRTA
jgi:hypothetical protein